MIDKAHAAEACELNRQGKLPLLMRSRWRLEEGPAPTHCNDGKGVNCTVDQALGKPRGSGDRKPAASHPWRQRERAAAELATVRREGSRARQCRPCRPLGSSAPPKPEVFLRHSLALM